jgi:hypothetical protein
LLSVGTYHITNMSIILISTSSSSS